MTKRVTAQKDHPFPPQPRRVQTTIILSEDLWRRVKYRAIEERSDLKDIATRANETNLQTPLPEVAI